LDPFKVYLESEGYNGHEIAKGTDMAIAVNITQNTLAKLAVGIQDSMVSNILWMLLLEGVKVVMNTQSVFEGAQPLDKNPVMRSVFEGYVEKVMSFGAEMIDGHKYQALFNQAAEIADVMVPVKEVVTAQKLINEQAILNLNSDVKELVLQKGQIITPAAKDLANARRITIRKE
jgi:ethanolamine utilization protein